MLFFEGLSGGLTSAQEHEQVPAGSTVKTLAHFDNSVKNRYNPNPDQEVYWGLQSWDEMFIIFTEYSVDKNNISRETSKALTRK